MEHIYTFVFGWACGGVNLAVLGFGVYAVMRARQQNGWPGQRPQAVDPEDHVVMPEARGLPPLPVAGDDDDPFVVVRRIRSVRR